MGSNVVSLFLFDDAFKRLWKEEEGSLVFIANPKPMKERGGGFKPANGANPVALSLTNGACMLVCLHSLCHCLIAVIDTGLLCGVYHVCHFCRFSVYRWWARRWILATAAASPTSAAPLRTTGRAAVAT